MGRRQGEKPVIRLCYNNYNRQLNTPAFIAEKYNVYNGSDV